VGPRRRRLAASRPPSRRRLPRFPAPARALAVAEVRATFAKLIADKHTSVMTRMGAVLAQGIIDAGGRNSVAGLVSQSGFLKMSAVVGMALWLQHWYWFPTMHFISLALAPTPLVGLNADFALPAAFAVPCAAPASWFAYPPKLADKPEDAASKLVSVTLSTSAKAKAKAAAKAAAKKGDKDAAAGAAAADAGAATGAGAGAGAGAAAAAAAVVPTSGTADAAAPAAAAMDVDGGAAAPAAAAAAAAAAAGAAAAPAAAAAAAAPEPPTHVLSNPSRVTFNQTRFCDFAVQRGQRYLPVRPVRAPAPRLAHSARARACLLACLLPRAPAMITHVRTLV
jgi:26S proteasome regulatory subunit N2